MSARRIALAACAALASGVIGLWPASVAAHDGHQQRRWTPDDTLAALSVASDRANCIVGYETGFTYEPYSVGRAGELGPVQLHPYGLLPEFYSWAARHGLDGDPFDPYEAVLYLDWKLQQRYGPQNWTPVLRGLC